jgi:hypothetical protein
MIHAGGIKPAAAKPLAPEGESGTATKGGAESAADTAAPADAPPKPQPQLAATIDHIPKLPNRPMEHGDTILIDKEGKLQFVDESATQD